MSKLDMTGGLAAPSNCVSYWIYHPQGQNTFHVSSRTDNHSSYDNDNITFSDHLYQGGGGHNKGCNEREGQ